MNIFLFNVALILLLAVMLPGKSWNNNEVQLRELFFRKSMFGMCIFKKERNIFFLYQKLKLNNKIITRVRKRTGYWILSCSLVVRFSRPFIGGSAWLLSSQTLRWCTNLQIILQVITLNISTNLKLTAIFHHNCLYFFSIVMLMTPWFTWLHQLWSLCIDFMSASEWISR